jgi:hypothetical protein
MTTHATPSSAPCLTCYGTGEAATDGGAPERCPDCFGEGKALGRSTKLEWRLRALERAYGAADGETRADVTWLISEVRHAREALVRILARCAEGGEGESENEGENEGEGEGEGEREAKTSGAAKDAMYIANEALGLYEPHPRS